MNFKESKNAKYIVLLAVILISAFFIFDNIQSFLKEKNKKVENEIILPTNTADQTIMEKFGANYFAPIFTFHNIVENPKKDPYGLTVDKTEFENHLKALKNNGYKYTPEKIMNII